MNWLWMGAKRLPKVALVFGVIGISTALFAFWWFTRSPKKVASHRVEEARVQDDTKKKAEQVGASIGHLILVDNDLYDFESGELIFTQWLKSGMPQRLFYDS